MFIVLEGQAKAIYEDTLERKGEVCSYSRRSIRTDLPKELKFGLKNFQSSLVSDTTSPRSILKKSGKSSKRQSTAEQDKFFSVNNNNSNP